MDAQRSEWASRFIYVTFALGAIAWAVLAILVLGNVLAGLSPPNYALGPASSRIVAGGGAGTWFVMGLVAYLLVGIVGLGMSALFYQHLEVTLGSPLSGWRNILAWLHLTLGGAGAAAASLVMTYSGFLAGAAALPISQGGLGEDAFYIHANILGPVTEPIAILMGIALLGYLFGGIALVSTWWAARKK